MRKPIDRPLGTVATGSLTGARRLLAEKGYAGMELRDVAARGKAPRALDLPPLPRRQEPNWQSRPQKLEGREIRAAIEKLARRARPRRDPQHLRRDVPPPASRTSRSGSAARSPPPPSPGPRTRPSPPPPRRPSRAGKPPIAAALRDEGVGRKDAEALRRPRRLDDRGRPDPRPRRRRPGPARLRGRRPAPGARSAARVALAILTTPDVGQYRERFR